MVSKQLSVLRLRSNDRTQLIDAAEHVINAWRSWTDESVGVIARTDDGVPHNTVTPIARRVDSAGHAGGDRYELCLALRCNIATDEHPLGVFHPDAEYHHIEKENIGLIEVMGLAILPPRLKDEMAAVECVLIQGADERLSSEQVLDRLSAADATASHAAWAAEVYATRHDEIGADSAHDIVLEEVGVVFGHVLENAGVSRGTARVAPPSSALSTRSSRPLSPPAPAPTGAPARRGVRAGTPRRGVPVGVPTPARPRQQKALLGLTIQEGLPCQVRSPAARPPAHPVTYAL